MSDFKGFFNGFKANIKFDTNFNLTYFTESMILT